MKAETYQSCLNIAKDFKEMYGVSVTVNIFKDVMIQTLRKMGRIRSQLDEGITTDEYIPLLFKDCLYEHYMFDKADALREEVIKSARAVV